MVIKQSTSTAKASPSKVKAAYAKVRDYILRNRIPSGFWPYIAGNRAATEPSAWCAIAMRDENDIAEKALSALMKSRNDDGGWSTEPNASQHSDWTSASALLAVRVLQESLGKSGDKSLNAQIQKSFNYAYDSRTEFYNALARMVLLVGMGQKGLEYPRGWPWSPECCHWIEPTSYALLALKLPSPPKHKDYTEVIDRANAFMLEHECVGGGWNHGNNICLNVNLPPYVLTSSEALLALQDVPLGKPQETALAFVAETSKQECAAIERAWTILALNAYGKPTDELAQSLAQTQNADGSFGINMLATALCALALETSAKGKNALKYTGAMAKMPDFKKVPEPPIEPSKKT